MRCRRLCVALLAALMLLPLVPPAQATQEEPHDWRDALRRATASALQQPYTGEAVLVTWDEGRAYTEVVEVRASRSGLTVASPDRYTVRFDEDGGGLVDHEQGWFVPLPPAQVGLPASALPRIAEKYAVEVTPTDELLGRPAKRLDLRVNGGRLRERVWIDDASGLVLRRETYDAKERLVRLTAYLSLDLSPGLRARTPPGNGRRQVPLQPRHQGVMPVDSNGVRALRDAGWVMPAELPNGYKMSAVYAVAADRTQPVQVVYGDGLYYVSMFQQQGRPDWSSLPPGRQPAPGLGPAVFTWPGAAPRRVVWESEGRTFSLVGEVPPDELRAIVEALPAAVPPSLLERLRWTLSALYRRVSPW